MLAFAEIIETNFLEPDQGRSSVGTTETVPDLRIVLEVLSFVANIQ